MAEVDDVPSSESSGLAAIQDGFLTLDDSGAGAELHQFDVAGNFLGTITVYGASNTDWEDLAVRDCDEGSCVYIGDIGDNDEVRDTIVVWRAPLDGLAPITATACTLAYDDGPHDAEALLVFPDESVRVVTKNADGEAKVYFADALGCDGGTATLTREVELDLGAPVTGGAVSADGATVVLRGATEGWAWRGCTLDWGAVPTGLLFVGEEQGEAVSIGADGTLWSSSEGKAFELHRLQCAESAPLACTECGCGGSGSAPWSVVAGALLVFWWRKPAP